MQQEHQLSNTTNQQKANWKYRLFDLAITLTIAAAVFVAARRSFDRFSVKEANNNNSDYTNRQDEENLTTEPATLPTFQVGNIVEVYEPTIHPSYAFFAKIDQIVVSLANCDSDDDDNNDGSDSIIQYNVQAGFGGFGANRHAIYENIRASAIRPMKPFEEGTQVMCDDGKSLNTNLYPCTIDSHIVSSSGSGKNIFGVDGHNNQQYNNIPSLYSVSFQIHEDGEWREKKKIMPISRIRRIARRDLLEDGECADDETTSCSNEATSSTTTHENENPQGQFNTPTTALEEEDSTTTTTFAIGSAVEIYGPGAYFAIPATVTGVTRGSRTYEYNLLHGQSNLKDVEMQFVHPYRVYDVGTEASCNVGKLSRNGVVMVPCTVLSNVEESSKRGGEIVYRVLTKKLEGVEEVERVLFLPRMRVQRYHEKLVDR